MAFIDWLRDQHRTSEGRRSEFNDPRLNPFQQTPHGFSARNYGSRANMPSPLATGGAPVPSFRPTFDPRSGVSPSQNYGLTGGSLGAFPTSPARPASPGNVPFAPQFDPRSGYGVGGMGGNMPPDGMWDLIVAALMDKWKGVKKGKKKIQSRIDRNRVRRERRFDYEG